MLTPLVSVSFPGATLSPRAFPPGLPVSLSHRGKTSQRLARSSVRLRCGLGPSRRGHRHAPGQERKGQPAAVREAKGDPGKRA